MNSKFLIWSAVSAMVFGLSSCNEEAEIHEEPVDVVEHVDTTPKVPTPDFNADSAYFYVQNQVDFGPRTPNSEAHKLCGEWMISELKKYNFEVITQEGIVTAWNGDKLNMKNIIGQFNKDAEERILLAAHWDTRPYADRDSTEKFKPIDGANDGASGVGVLLEIARQISMSDPGYGVDIIFFDAEDYGTFDGKAYNSVNQMLNDWCLGSQYWAKNPPIADYSPKYGILLDMVGAPDATFPKEGVSVQFAAPKVTAIWNAADNLGYGKYFVKKLAGGITDDHTFVNNLAGIPMLDIIDMRMNGQYFSFGSFHHTHGDNMSVIDKNTLKAVGQTVLHAIYQKL
ncbi:MAG: M28 family peptidase [Flavobacteriales bacterium]|nr:M28 family peptidase [Flavobacteriales bacterium]